jgi:uncharacterized membrane protein
MIGLMLKAFGIKFGRDLKWQGAQFRTVRAEVTRNNLGRVVQRLILGYKPII